MRPTSVEEAAAYPRRGERGRSPRAHRLRPRDRRARPRARARGRRPHLHGRGRDQALGAAGGAPRPPVSGSRSTRPATRRVGACLAGRLSGPLSHRFGTPRDLVLGVTLVLGDGTIASSGGKVVKNVAGYDLGKLVCGSEGRLALVARVSLRLHPLPQQRRDARRRDGRHGGRRPRARPARGSSRARSTSSTPAGSRCSSRARRAPCASSSTRRARSSAASRATARSGASRVSARDGALGRLRFVPADLANTLTTLDEAVVRPSAGIAYVPHRVGGVPSAAARRLHRALAERLDPAGVLA